MNTDFLQKSITLESNDNEEETGTADLLTSNFDGKHRILDGSGSPSILTSLNHATQANCLSNIRQVALKANLNVEDDEDLI